MASDKIRVISVVGARPNFVKISSFMREMQKTGKFLNLLVHTGQHYDRNMSQLFFKDLSIPRPNVNLGVKGTSHAAQTGEIMKRFEKVCLDFKPQLVVVVGDVNSTIACALTAVKLGIKVAHIEAGLRSFDRTMPEEINRILTDTISDFLFVSEPSGMKNLKKEGIPSRRVFFVGNTMIDTLLSNKNKAKKSSVLNKMNLTREKYSVLTLHRPSNVDDRETLRGIFKALEKISKQMPIVFPIHPRTLKKIRQFRINTAFLRIVPPLGYLDFLCLMENAKLVLTDSGGIQEETTILGIPCLTLRKNTERPVTAEKGTNKIAGVNPAVIEREARRIMEGKGRRKVPIKFWDGNASSRIIKKLLSQIR
jgi:UDP-N-acetylglucosamine 2-epimerase (non-hydrolysing)